MALPIARWAMSAEVPQGIRSQVVHLVADGTLEPLCGTKGQHWRLEGLPNPRRKVCRRCEKLRRGYLTPRRR